MKQNNHVTLDDAEVLDELENLCIMRGSWPRQHENNEQETEGYVARKVARKQFRDNLQPQLQQRFDNLKAKYGRTISPENLVTLMEEYVSEYQAFPQKNSRKDYEHRLANQYAAKKSRGTLTDEQIDLIEGLRSRYGGCRRVSRPEKTAYAAMADVYGKQHVHANEKYGGFEMDIAIMPRGGGKIGIQYDGVAYHSAPDSMERDIRANAAHAAEGFEVIRIREIGCCDLNQEGIHTIQVTPGSDASLHEAVLGCIAIIEGEPCHETKLDWDETLRRGASLSTNRASAVAITLEYIGYVLANSKTPPTSKASRDGRMYRAMKKARYDRRLSKECLAVIAFAKAQAVGLAGLDDHEIAALKGALEPMTSAQ